MYPSVWLYQTIKDREQFRPTAFKPTKNDVWTIAWGHTNGVKEGDTCTYGQGEIWLREDVQGAVNDVNAHCERCFPGNPNPLTQKEFDALCDLVYNIGDNAFNNSTLLRYLNAGDDKDASEQFLVWDKQAGGILRGLLLRRQAEKAHFDGGP